jgi:hypothetical protein
VPRKSLGVLPHQCDATQNLKTDQRQQQGLDNIIAIDAAHGVHYCDVYSRNANDWTARLPAIAAAA